MANPLIEYAEEGVMSVRLGIGPEVQHLTEQGILDRHKLHEEPAVWVRDPDEVDA